MDMETAGVVFLIAGVLFAPMAVQAVLCKSSGRALWGAVLPLTFFAEAAYTFFVVGAAATWPLVVLFLVPFAWCTALWIAAIRRRKG